MSRIKEFVDYLGVNLYFEKYLDKQQLREDKDWTCCTMLCSTRNRKLSAINIEEVHRKTKEFFDDVTLWYDKESTKAIFDEVRICAENGDAKCMNVMGLFYIKGIFVEKCNNEAFAWFKLAAEYGYTRAVRNLSLMYNPQIQISAESETKRSIFREKDKTKRSKKESAQHSKSRNKSFVMTSVSAL